MRTHNPFALLYAPLLVISFTALNTACSDGTTTDDSGTTGVIDENNNGTNQDELDALNAANGTTGTGTTDGSATMSNGQVQRTAAEERMVADTDMRGLRSTLVAELEAVRARLNVGTNPSPEREADQTRAAELAQGLERVDRALATLDASTDETWASTREAQLKEVEDVREWLRKYEHGETTVSH